MKRHAWQARLGLLCAALLTLTLCLPLAAQAEGPKDMGPYLTGSTLSKQAAPVASGDTLALADALTLSYRFELDAEELAALEAGAAYALPLPQYLAVAGTGSVNLSLDDGTPLGVLSIGGGAATLAFDPGVQDLDSLRGCHVELSCALDAAAIGDRQEVSIALPGGASLTVRIADNQPVAPRVGKSGQQVADGVAWTVTMEGGKMSEGVLTETLPAGLSYAAGSAALDGAPITPEADGQKLTFTLPEDDAGAQRTLTYRALPEDAALFLKDGVWRQQAADVSCATNLQLSDGRTAKASASVTLQPPYRLDVSSSYAASGDVVTWTLTWSSRTAPSAGDAIAVTLPGYGGMDAVTQVEAYIDGAATPTALGVTGGRFSLPLAGRTGTQTMTFQTALPADFYHQNQSADLTLSATAALGANQLSTSWGKQRVSSSVVSKSGVYNPATGEITWTVAINANGLDLGPLTLTDTLPEGEPQQLVDGIASSMEIQGDEGIILYLDFPQNRRAFTLDTHGADWGTRTVTLTYRTRVTDPALYAGNAAWTAKNDAVLDATLAGTTTAVSQRVVGTAACKSVVAQKEMTGYDYQANQASWKITVNANRIKLTGDTIEHIPNAWTLEDAIPEGQTLIEDSWKMEAAGGNIPKVCRIGEHIILAYYNLAQGQSATLTYKTQVDPRSAALDFTENGEVTLSNTATLTPAGSPAVSVTATGKMKNQLLAKSCAYTRGQDWADFTIRINRSGAPLEHRALTDVMDAGLLLDMTTVRLFQAVVAEDGGMTAGEPVDAGAYRVAYDGPTGVLTVALPEADIPYVLTYSADILEGAGGSLSNTVSLGGTAAGPSSACTVEGVFVGGGGGGSASRKGSFTLTLTDEDAPPWRASPMSSSSARASCRCRRPTRTASSPSSAWPWTRAIPCARPGRSTTTRTRRICRSWPRPATRP